MKQLYLVANWKSNKTIEESITWIQSASWRTNLKLKEGIIFILCPPFIALATLKDEIQKANFPILLGVQNISQFGNGAYTGEISAQMLKGLVEYVLVGHSERRKYFSENDDMLFKKVEQVKLAGLKVIYCVESSTVSVPLQVDLIAYEPIAAIGSGKPENPEDAERVCKQIKEKHTNIPILYGGSVTPDNIAMYLKQPSIDGALVGGASLDPERFFHLIEASFI